MHRCIRVEKKNQLDATEWFIALIICSTCFGHFYAHHQEVETIRLFLPLWCAMPCLLVVGAQVQSSRLCVRNEGCCSSSSNIPHSGRITCFSAPDLQQPANKASHTIRGNNTHIVSRSWRCAQKFPKHVEHIISTINLSVASSWFFFFTHEYMSVGRPVPRSLAQCSISIIFFPKAYI